MKSHPKRELYLGKHPPETFGCTACHNGDGVAVNSVKYAHCNYYEHDGVLHPVHLRENLALFRGTMMQTNCIKCHSNVQALEGADVIARGEKLFIEMGCHGCHLSEGYEDLARVDDVPAIGPSLRKIGSKVNPAWLVKWITNPQAVRPRTRMPNFMFSEDQATSIAAYLLYTTAEPSTQWAAANPDPAISPAVADVEAGRKLVDSIGCRGCHALAPDEIAGQVGADKNIAPNLSDIMSKTDARWIYHWIKNPQAYSHVARMPSLRLTDAEARAITAYLSTLGTPTPVPATLPDELKKP
jgi:mono/diheme cytochrome c family protein